MPILHQCILECNAVKHLNKGRFGQYIFSCCVLFREVVLFLKVQNVLNYWETNYLGPSKSILCREVYYFVSLSQRFHYQMFYCSLLKYALAWMQLQPSVDLSH